MTIETVAYEPSPVKLASLASTINKAVLQYSQATSDTERTTGLRQIEVTSQKLAQCVVEPRRSLMAFHFQPHKVLCVRLAIEMGLFDNLPTSAPFTIYDLTKSTGTDPDFTWRIVRTLGALDIFEEVDEGVFKQTALSREWTNKYMQSYTRHSWDNVFRSMSSYLEFFRTTGFVSPFDRMNTPFAFSRGTFNEAMTSFKDPLGDLYDFGSLEAGKDGIVLVDIGGGKGQSIQSICSAYPDLKGRYILQELPAVIAAGDRVCPPEVEVQPYNFFEQVQPVQGAAAYLLKLILHDWQDAECKTILRNLAPAMRGYKSKLLICDIVLSDFRPNLQKVLYDINMFFMAGKERSVKQWHALMEGTGFRIERIVGLDNSVRSVIEAVLDD
ncbi:O-methyltransferase-domain-containing protein [Aspergillus californicus]